MYRDWILREPIEGALTAVRPDRTAGLNRGRRHGVYPGMRFRRRGDTGEPRSFVVTDLEEETCAVRFLSAQASYPLVEGDVLWCDAKGSRLGK